MWTRSLLLIVVFLFLYVFEPSTSSGRVSVHLLEYHRSSDAGCKGGLFSSNPCDLQFTVCFKGLSDKDSCTKTSDQYSGTRDVKFGTNINGGIANPIVKSFTALQTGAGVEVKVGDDYWSSSDPLPLDDLKTPLPPSHSGATLTLTNTNARLTLTIIVTCDLHFYGPICSVLCNPGSADHYTCGPDGTKHCIKGFTGSCQQTPCHNIACHNGGKCVVEGPTYNCSCLSGFSGTRCETTPCTMSPCQNQGTCHFTGSKVTCSCKSGYNGPLCENTPCTKNPCQNQGTCHVFGSKATCSCKSGFNGSLCETTPCTKNPCQNHGTCHVVGSKATCSCKSGFNGTHCETTPCTKNPCQNQETCHFTGSKVTCSCSPGYNGMHCDVLSNTKEVTLSMAASSTDPTLPYLPTQSGCPHNISNCVFAECLDLTPVRCVRCRAGYMEVEGRCMTCPHNTPILHCDEEQSVGCLFRWCSRCEQGFYREASACEVCPRLHAGCRNHVCTSSDDVRCVRCDPGFFLAGTTCKECPSPNPMCDVFTCSDSSDVTCTKCKDGFLEVGGQCLLCPSTSLIPDCVDVARDGCFKHWCRKCSPGFFISGTACDVCPPPGVGCQLAECNSTQDSHCVKCFHGYDLKDEICTRSHGNESATISTQCVDNPHVDCASLHSSLNVCSETTTACEYCPRYCNICKTCTQGVPIIG